MESKSLTLIMDFGCPNGYSAMRLAEMNKDITFVGVDINPYMLDAAMESLHRSNLTNIQFRYLDITREHYKTVKYDFIFAICVFQNMASLSSRSDNIYIDVAKKPQIFMTGLAWRGMCLDGLWIFRRSQHGLVFSLFIVFGMFDHFLRTSCFEFVPLAIGVCYDKQAI